MKNIKAGYIKFLLLFVFCFASNYLNTLNYNAAGCGAPSWA
jgi:hypothetical protein